MVYWIRTSTIRSFSVSTYVNGKQVNIKIANGYGDIKTVNENELLTIEELSPLLEKYNIVQVSTSAIPISTVTETSVVVTTTLSTVTLVEENINDINYETSIEVNDFAPENYFTNASSYRKYIRNGQNPLKPFIPAKTFSEVFYPTETETISIPFGDYYVGMLLEFDIKYSYIENNSNFSFLFKENPESLDKNLGSLIVNKTQDNILLKNVSPYSSYMYVIDGENFYASTSEMSGIVLPTSTNPNRYSKIKIFFFNNVFYEFSMQFKNSISSYKNVKRLNNVLTDPSQIYTTTTTSSTTTTSNTSTTTTTTTAINFNTANYLYTVKSINTMPIHFVVTTYRQ